MDERSAEYLRHAASSRLLSARALECRPQEEGKGISLTRYGEELKPREALQRYQLARPMPSGDLPALWLIQGVHLAQCFIHVEPDPLDGEFGHLHCVTKGCPTEEQRDQLAALTTQAAKCPILPFVPKAKVCRPKG